MVNTCILQDHIVVIHFHAFEWNYVSITNWRNIHLLQKKSASFGRLLCGCTNIRRRRFEPNCFFSALANSHILQQSAWRQTLINKQWDGQGTVAATAWCTPSIHYADLELVIFILNKVNSLCNFCSRLIFTWCLLSKEDSRKQVAS